MKEKLKDYGLEVLAWSPQIVMILAICFLFFIAKQSVPVHAHTEPNFQRIRQDDRIIVWKFKDAGNECYVTTTEWYYVAKGEGIAISCVKRGN